MTTELYYTMETRLEMKENLELKEYLDKYVSFYNEVVRYVWRQLTSPDFTKKYKSKAKFNTYISQKYNLLIRTVKLPTTCRSGGFCFISCALKF